MMEIADSVPEILKLIAAGGVPVNVAVDIAIQAHQQHPCEYSLYVVVLACRPTLEDEQRQLDYLAGLPDRLWQAVPNCVAYQAEVLACIRRSIAWRSICV